MLESDTWAGGVAMETAIWKDSTGSRDGLVSMNSNHSDDSLDYFSPDVRATLLFLEATIESLEAEDEDEDEEDSSLSNDELETHTHTPASHSSISDKIANLCMPTHTKPEGVSRYHEDPNQVMGRDHKPALSYMVPTPLLLANRGGVLRPRSTSSAAEYRRQRAPESRLSTIEPRPSAPELRPSLTKPRPSDLGPSTHVTEPAAPVPNPTSINPSDHVTETPSITASTIASTTASKSSADAEDVPSDKLTTDPSGTTTTPDPVKVDAGEVITDVPNMAAEGPSAAALKTHMDTTTGGTELIAGETVAVENTEMATDANDASTSGDPVELIPANPVDYPAAGPKAAESQAPETAEGLPEGSSEVGIVDESNAAASVENNTPPAPPQSPGTVTMETGIGFIPPPMAFMDEPPATDDSEKIPEPSAITLIADVSAPDAPVQVSADAGFPASDIPEPVIPARDVPPQSSPDTAFPMSEIPAPVIPAMDISAQNSPDTSFPVSDIPAPLISSPDIPSQNTSDAAFPASDIPPPVVPSTDAGSQPPDIPDPVTTPPEIPAANNQAPDIPTNIIPCPDIPVSTPPAPDSPESKGADPEPPVSPVLKSPPESVPESTPPAPRRGPLTYSELQKLKKAASMKKPPGMVPVVQIRTPRSLSQSSPTTEAPPPALPSQDQGDPKSPPAVAPKPKKLPPNISFKAHREPGSGPVRMDPQKVRMEAGSGPVRMDPQKVRMEALRKLGLLKSDECDSAPSSASSASSPSLSPGSHRSWAPPQSPLTSPGAASSSSGGPPTPEMPPKTAPPVQPPTRQNPSPTPEALSPQQSSPDPPRKMVEVLLDPRQVSPRPPEEGGEGAAESLLGGGDDFEDRLEVPDHLPPSPPTTPILPSSDNNNNNNHSNSSNTTGRCHGISVQISPLSDAGERRTALRKLGLVQD